MKHFDFGASGEVCFRSVSELADLQIFLQLFIRKLTPFIDEGEGEQQDYEDVFKKDVLCTLRVVEAIEERFKCLSKVDCLSLRWSSFGEAALRGN